MSCATPTLVESGTNSRICADEGKSLTLEIRFYAGSTQIDATNVVVGMRLFDRDTQTLIREETDAVGNGGTILDDPQNPGTAYLRFTLGVMDNVIISTSLVYGESETHVIEFPFQWHDGTTQQAGLVDGQFEVVKAATPT